MIEIHAYDEPTRGGRAIIAVAGQHDISRLVRLLDGGPPSVEWLAVGKTLRARLRRHTTGRAALTLLRQHGGNAEADGELTAADICEVGDPDPTPSADDEFIPPICYSQHGHYACTREKGHGGQHVAGTGSQVVAAWTDPGEATP